MKFLYFKIKGHNSPLIIFLSIFLIGLINGLAYASNSANFFNDQKDLGHDIRPPDVIHWTPHQAIAYPDGSVEISLSLKTINNFSIYKKNLTFSSDSEWVLESFQEPEFTQILDPISQENVNVFTAGQFKLFLYGLEEFKGKTFPLSIKYLGCTSIICLFPYVETFDIPIYSGILAEKLPPLAKKNSPITEPPIQGKQETSPSTSSFASYTDDLATRITSEALSIWLLLLFALIGGLLTNLTPCVYPMIPITIRVLKGQTNHPLLASLFYALGIVVTYTALGVTAAATGSMFGSFMGSKVFNLSFAAVMFLMAMTMLGYGNLSFLQNLGTKFDTRKSGVTNAFILGAGAGLVASPCTGPILAALLTYSTTQSDFFHSSSLIFTYSLGFALPYVFLGGFAAKLYQIKAPIKLQLLSKLFFAAIMFALSFYYLKIPAYRALRYIAPYWQYLSFISIFTGVISSLMILKKLTNFSNKSLAIVPSLILGFGIFCGYEQMTQNPMESHVSLDWLNDETEAMNLAKLENRPILIDMWAEWCSACKKMDAYTFSDIALREKIKHKNWILLKLDLTESNDKNDEIEERYNLQGLPALIILPPPSLKLPQVSLHGYIGVDTLIKYIDKF